MFRAYPDLRPHWRRRVSQARLSEGFRASRAAHADGAHLRQITAILAAHGRLTRQLTAVLREERARANDATDCGAFGTAGGAAYRISLGLGAVGRWRWSAA